MLKKNLLAILKGKFIIQKMEFSKRITFDPNVMSGKPCIRGMRVTVGMVLGLLARSVPMAEILQLYPYLEAEDIAACLHYAAWRVQENEIPFTVAV